jgi:OOP family OmpA-OmpF porin
LGNRGRVFGAWEPPKPPTVTVYHPPLPPVSEPRTIICTSVVLNNILFDFDKTTLKPAGTAEIDKLVREMQKYIKDTLVCIGHTDDAGSPEYNMALGEKRAMAVKNYMVESGIAAERIAIRSMGESQPAVPNDSRPNRALNRRVVFEITVGN